MYRLIIADDEFMECKVLEKILCENCPDITVLSSAANGIDLVSAIEKEVPDIALVDINMPGLNGLDAIEIIRRKHPSVKILVISAYSKFEYAQKALTLGASDYILKPVKEEVFVTAIQKLCRELDAEKRKKEEHREIDEMMRNYKSAVENEFISDIILGDARAEDLQKYLDTLPHPFYGAFLLSVQMSSEDDCDFRQHYLDFLHHLKRICTCAGKIQKHTLILCVIPAFSRSVAEYRLWLRESIECVAKCQEPYYRFLIGVSTFKFAIQELSDGVRESQIALLHSTSGEISFWGLDKEGNEREGELFRYSSEREKCLLYISQKQYSSFMKTLEQIITKAEQTEEPLAHLQIYSLGLMCSILQELLSEEPHRSDLLFLTWTYWERILHQQTYCGLSEALKSIIREILGSDSTKKQYNRHILNSLDYIAHHYMDDLALETVAEQNNISSFYLSRLFRQELHQTFLEILTDVRISQALKLLFTGNDSVQEISEKCGYLNVSYFYKIFKKQTGMTIGEMRNLIYSCASLSHS